MMDKAENREVDPAGINVSVLTPEELQGSPATNRELIGNHNNDSRPDVNYA